jgi:hypothetical protein
MLDTIAASGAGEPSDALLAQAQQSLRAALWRESMKESAMRQADSQPPLWARLFGFARGGSGGASGGGPRPAFRLGLAAAATLAVGFFAGYLAFKETPREIANTPGQQVANGAYTSFSNVQILDVDPAQGEVDIIYDQVRPVRLKTTVTDERAQDVLAYAMVNGDNAGVRLRAISAFESAQMVAPPEDMKQALLQALTSDPNAGVRLQALHLLRRLPFGREIKTTLMYVLSNDDNPGVRVAAMNFLAETTIEGSMPEREMYDILGSKMPKD